MTAVGVMRPSLTVTEALAEIKTLTKRIAKRQENVFPYLSRFRAVADPLLDDIPEGGSVEFIRRERQAAVDLEERLVALRTAIQQRNLEDEVTIDGESRTIQQWLNWRKEILPGKRVFYTKLRAQIEQLRREATNKQIGVVNVDNSGDAKYKDIVINLSEAELAREIEHLEYIVGELDGQLSLKNATTTITVGE